jgi:hypothetical protein
MSHWLSPLLLYRSHCGKQDLVFARLDNQQSVVLLNDGDANLTMELPFGLPDADTRAIAVWPPVDNGGFVEHRCLSSGVSEPSSTPNQAMMAPRGTPISHPAHRQWCRQLFFASKMPTSANLAISTS